MFYDHKNMDSLTLEGHGWPNLAFRIYIGTNYNNKEDEKNTY